MRKFLLPIALVSIQTAFSQITITFADFASIGDDVKVAQDTLPDPSILPGSAGASVSWDFAALNVHFNSINSFIDPVGTVNASYFPASNIVYENSSSLIYLSANSSGVEVLGADGDIVGAGVSFPIPFSDPQKVLNLPANYGDVYSDTTYFRKDVKATDLDPSLTLFDSIRIAHWGFASVEMDAWGSMIIPGDTIDVLRKKKIEYTVDTVWVKAFGLWQLAPPIPPLLTANPRLDTLRSYEWYGNNEGYTLVTMNVDQYDMPEDVSYIFKGTMAISSTGTDVSCYGWSDGSAVVNFSTVGPGVPPYTYLWSNGSTDATLSSVPAGTYSVTVWDSNFDIATADVTIGQPTAIAVTNVVTNATCNTCNDGSISLNVTGGTPGYTYLWADLSTTNPNDDLLPGDYNVTITDINGCQNIQTVTVGVTLSISESFEKTLPFTIYPNPTKDNIYIENINDVEIFDLIGNKVLTLKNVNKQTINISSLKQGIYIVSGTINNKKVSRKLTVY